MQPGTFVKSHYYKHQIGIYQHERGIPEMFSIISMSVVSQEFYGIILQEHFQD